MSDPDRRTLPLAEWGESARVAVSGGEKPPGGSLDGEIRVRGVVSERSAAFSEGDINQLALALAERMAAPKARWTFGELAADWLGRVRRVRLGDEKRNVVQLRPLWGLKEDTLTQAAIEDWFAHLVEAGFSPISINKYRCAGKLVVRDAQARGKWGAVNPFQLVRRLKEKRRLYELLSVEEIRRVLPHLEPSRRRMAKLMVMLGFRPGELLALTKGDVDFTNGVIHIRRSHGRDSTKTGQSRTVPLLNGIAGDLLDAIRESPSDVIFPRPDGTRQRADTKMCRVLQTAMGKAGVVTGYVFTCRAGGCEQKMEFAGECPLPVYCPTHDWKMWKTPVVRDVRWYDLRHCAATHHRMAGADPRAVQLLLGHAGNVTEEVYTHMGNDWLRRELSKFVL